MLVERQGDVLTDIEQNAEYAAGHVQQGNTVVDRAIKQAKATRHVSCPTTNGTYNRLTCCAKCIEKVDMPIAGNFDLCSHCGFGMVVCIWSSGKL